MESSWLSQLFNARAARTGGVVQRNLSDVRRYASLELLEEAVRERGFHMLVTGGQCVVLCNPGRMRVVC